MGQADSLRFRNFYSYTFNPSHLMLVLFSLLLTMYSLVYVCYNRQKISWLPTELLFLLWWGIASFLSLFLFYLYSPSISSRYIVDFTGSIVAMMIFWVVFVAHVSYKRLGSKAMWIVVCLFIFIAALGISKEFFKYEASSRTLTQEEMMKETYAESAPYEQSFLDNTGWDTTTGFASSTILILMKNIRGIEMSFEGVCDYVKEEGVMAKIGNTHIYPSVEKGYYEETFFTFAVPQQYQTNITWPVFIKLFELNNARESETGCRLIEVNWQ
jgi:hypothetical protein